MGFCVADSNGQHWIFTAANDGTPVANATAAPTENDILRDYFGDPRCWRATLDDTGSLVSTAVPFDPAKPDRVMLFAPNGDTYFIGIIGAAGQFITDLANVLHQLFVTGQIYPGNPGLGPGAYPVTQQPGGTGQSVTSPQTPQQPNPYHLPEDMRGQPQETSGKWMAGCGHFFNSFDIKKVAMDADRAALMCCPLCGWIEKIVIPYDRIHDDIEMSMLQ